MLSHRMLRWRGSQGCGCELRSNNRRNPPRNPSRNTLQSRQKVRPRRPDPQCPTSQKKPKVFQASPSRTGFAAPIRSGAIPAGSEHQRDRCSMSTGFRPFLYSMPARSDTRLFFTRMTTTPSGMDKQSRHSRPNLTPRRLVACKARAQIRQQIAHLSLVEASAEGGHGAQVTQRRRVQSVQDGASHIVWISEVQIGVERQRRPRRRE